ncbi:unknown [Mycoplasma sp. CAG:956]|nr:unknown [Mycoplasma sp. CAG:956]
MEKKVIKLLVATDNKDTKILLDLGNGNRDEIIKKIEDVLKEEYSIDSKIIEKEEKIEPSLEIGKAIIRLASAFTTKEEEIDGVSNSIYVAYLMMKDEISLDKIMKYANFSMPELEIIKYYLIEKLKF